MVIAATKVTDIVVMETLFNFHRVKVHILHRF